MSAERVIKRCWFEILFFILFPLLMSWHLAWAFVLLIKECFKVYPSEIYELVRRMVYGKEDS
jgi:sensor histidine kinase regulating citrate/malate metabolism